MNSKLCNKIKELSIKNINKAIGKNKHFSFIIRRNSILAIGFNNSFKTHPKAKLYGYRFDAIHSELAVILKYKGLLQNLSDCVLVNTRINKFQQFGLAKPCRTCLLWLKTFNFRDIYYTDFNGEFKLLTNEKKTHQNYNSQ